MLSLIILICFFIILYIISIVIVPFLYIVGMIAPHTKDNISYNLVKFLVKVIKVISKTQINVKGLDNIPLNAPVLFVCNHNSFYDFLITFLTCPIKIGYMAKIEILKIPLAKTYMDYIHCTYVDRNDTNKSMKALKETISNIKNGHSMCIFPEGTRNKTDQTTLGEFKGGCRIIADKTNAIIVSIAITNSSDILEKHFPFIKKANVTIEYLKPIDFKSLDINDKKNIDKFLKNEIQERVIYNANR